MKKMIFFLLLAGGLLVSAQFANAQNKDTVSIMNAIKKNGYTVLNAGETIVLYKYQHASHSPKEAEKYTPKYYFTIAGSTVLQLLTKDNLKAAFPGNHKFHDALDATFKEDKDLHEYDSFHKMYKVSHILMMNS